MENQHEKQELRQAVQTFSRAVNRNRDDAWGYCNLGRALSQMECWDQAIEALREAIRIVPDFSRAHRSLADVYQQIGQRYEAAFHQKTASRLEKEAQRLAQQRRREMGTALLQIL